MTDLSALLARVEAAEGADQNFDGDIALALGTHTFGRQGRDTKPWFYPNPFPGYGRSERAPRFTASIDAALALVERVLPGWRWHMADGLFVQAGLSHPDGPKFGQGYAKAKTPALALIAALLKALITQATNTSNQEKIDE